MALSSTQPVSPSEGSNQGSSRINRIPRHARTQDPSPARKGKAIKTEEARRNEKPRRLEPIEEDQEEDEAQKVKVHRTGLVQSKWLPREEEVEEHMMAHVPYRSWCDICVKAKARSSPHLHFNKDQ